MHVYHGQIAPMEIRMSSTLARSWPEHIATWTHRADEALARGKADQLLIAAGNLEYRFEDDNPYPFAVNPQFKACLPVTAAPGSWISYIPGEKPRLVYLQPADYWHVVPEAPAGYWTDHFDIVIARTPDEVRKALPNDTGRCAILGPANSALDGVVPNNPEIVVKYLRYHRAFKTAWEVECMRVASDIGTRAHLAAQTAFATGASEFDIQMAYLHAAGLTQDALPYGNIVALNTHGAVLHYSHFDREPADDPRSLLIDAGASFNGYACDITRTHAAPAQQDFQALIDDMDAMQQGLCNRIVAGQSYVELHLDAHHEIATILNTHDIIRSSPEEAVADGTSRCFFPHGLGHGIGAQVHDIGGFMRSDEGGRIDPPEGHPALRLTRDLADGMVVTVEPGLYFIDMLLDELKVGPAGKNINWDKVDALKPCGGIRIEDDVACTPDGPLNLTREAFAAQ